MANLYPDVFVGPNVRGDGSNYGGARNTKEGAHVISLAGGSMGEATSRGQVFTGSTALAGTTIIAANVGASAAGAAVAFALYNPLGSGKNLEVLKTWLSGISGTPGVGMWAYAIGNTQSITATQNNLGVASGVPTPNRVGSDLSSARVFVQTALTGSTLQTLNRPIGSFFGGAIAATTSVNILDMVDGDIVVPPGGVLTVVAPLIGTTFVAFIGMQWREVTNP